MSDFEREYTRWDQTPDLEVTRNNVASFIVWSFYDAQGNQELHDMRMEEMKKVDLLKEIIAVSVIRFFTEEELEFMLESYVIERDLGDGQYHRRSFTVSSFADVVQEILTDIVKDSDDHFYETLRARYNAPAITLRPLGTEGE